MPMRGVQGILAGGGGWGGYRATLALIRNLGFCGLIQ